jgi:hypothetical protein
VTLESNRIQAAPPQLTIPTGTKTISLLIPVETGNRFQSFSVEVLRSKAPVANRQWGAAKSIRLALNQSFGRAT